MPSDDDDGYDDDDDNDDGDNDHDGPAMAVIARQTLSDHQELGSSPKCHQSYLSSERQN